MELDQLRHVLKLAEVGNFTRAAEAVGLSQPAFSRSVARLEEELGQPIFERQTKRVSLTDAGQRLHAKARQILSLVEDATAEFTDGDDGRLRIAAIPTIAPFLLPELLKEFGSQYPRATVIVQEDTTERLLKQLSDGEIDAAILARPIDAKYFDVEDLFEEELLLVMSTDHPLRDKKQIRIADIESLPFVLLGETHCLTGNVLSFCQQKSFHPVSVERTSQLATVQELVSLNHGVSLVPVMAAKLDTSHRRLYRSLAGPKPTRKIVLVSNPYRFQSQISQAFKRLVRCFK
ncbi:MAG: transcriptional regulator, LysR family [Schlesneria sp.]|nr:transcriptional regulator, LysR family [Schlesneria sp.]